MQSINMLTHSSGKQFYMCRQHYDTSCQTGKDNDKIHCTLKTSMDGKMST